MTRPAIIASSFVLAVPDADKTARWWIEALKFDDRTDLDGWVFVHRGPCTVMLGSCPGAPPIPDLGDHQYFGYIEFDDLDALAEEIDLEQVDVIFGPEDRPWGMREMGVRTPDGHRVMFGQPID